MRNTEKLIRFVQCMRAKKMAESTIKTYNSFLIKFFEYANEDSVRITGKTIQDYILQIPDKFSDSYRNQAINAIRLYFIVIEHKKIDAIFLPRPIKQQYIPNVLTREQVERVIFNTKNLKHRAILFTIYDNGLRISELINITLSDFHSKCERPYLVIKKAKHHKSRIIPLSERCVDLVRQYYCSHLPKKYLFESNAPGIAYSTTSIRNILNTALRRENIKYHIRVHDLRHSFVTHCLANETDIYHMANMIGHSSVKTTEKYYSHLNYTQLIIHR